MDLLNISGIVDIFRFVELGPAALVRRSMPKDFGINFEILPKIDFHSYRKIKLNWVCSNKRCVRKLSIFSEKHPGILNEIFL